MTKQTGSRDVDNAHGATEEIHILEERDHHKVDAHGHKHQKIVPHSQAGKPQHRASHACNQNGQRKARPKRLPIVGCQNGGGISANAEERGMAQRNLSGKACENVQAKGQSDPDAHEDRNTQHIVTHGSLLSQQAVGTIHKENNQHQKRDRVPWKHIPHRGHQKILGHSQDDAGQNSSRQAAHAT